MGPMEVVVVHAPPQLQGMLKDLVELERAVDQCRTENSRYRV